MQNLTILEQIDSETRLCLIIFEWTAIISVIANLLVAIIIYRNQKLQEDLANLLIFHIALIQIGYLILVPLMLRLVTNYSISHKINPRTICVINEIETSFLFISFLIIILLICNWFLKIFESSRYQILREFYKFFLTVIYMLAICITTIGIQFCKRDYAVPITGIMLFIIYLFTLVSLIIINVWYKVLRKPRASWPKLKRPSLAVVNIYILSWAPLFIFGLLASTGIFTATRLMILTILGFSSPITTALYLFHYDKNYNNMIKKLNCCGGSHQYHSVSFNQEVLIYEV